MIYHYINKKGNATIDINAKDSIFAQIKMFQLLAKPHSWKESTIHLKDDNGKRIYCLPLASDWSALITISSINVDEMLNELNIIVKDIEEWEG